MKQLTIGAFLGLVVALPIIYLLQPLNAGAIALIWLLCSGLIAALNSVLVALRRKGEPK